MKNHRLYSRVLCLVLSLMTLLLVVLPAAAVEVEMPEVRPAAAVRYGRGGGSLVIGYLENGAELNILNDGYDSVYQIDCYDMNGYISKEDVREEDGRYYVSCVIEEEQTRSLTPVQPEAAEQLRQSLLETAQSLLGIRYRWGGTTTKGFDCSGFIRYVFDKNGIALQRTAQQQISDGTIIAKDELQCGDLVFFTGTYDGGLVTHVGMYIGDGKMIHSGSSKGVSVASLDNSYFARHYLCARRIVQSVAEKTDTYHFYADSSVSVARTAEMPVRVSYVRNAVAISDKCDIIKLIMFSQKGVMLV